MKIKEQFISHKGIHFPMLKNLAIYQNISILVCVCVQVCVCVCVLSGV